MKKFSCLSILLSLLILNSYAVSADDVKSGQSSRSQIQLERQVFKLSASTSNELKISIPRSALTLRNAIPGVFVVENNEARFRMVRLGKINRSRVDILSGLFGNETLLLDELDAVHDGSPISIITKKAAVKK